MLDLSNYVKYIVEIKHRNIKLEGLRDPSCDLQFIMIETDTTEDERSKDYPRFLGTTHTVH